LAVADEPRYPILEEFPPRGMSSYKNFFEGHGEFCASASHQYTTTGNGSTWKAFDKTDMYGSDDSEWQTSGGTFSSGALAGSGLTTITNGIGAGVWIQLEMPYKIILKKWAIGQRTTQQNRHIKTGFLVGTNDGRKWDIIQTITGATSQTDYHHRYYDLSTNNLYHKTIRLVITEINGGDRPDINQIKFFGTREQGQSVLHDGQLTLTKSLTVPRIGPALDADDTPRRDRLVVEYNTSTNPTFEGAVRDTSGRGNDGVFVGTATYDAMQKSLEFPSNPVAGSTSGTYDSIFAGDIFKRKITQHTTSLWLKPNSMAAWEQVFGIGQNVSVAHEGLWISGTDRLAVHTEGGNPSQQYHYTIGNVNGQWIHVTLVRNSLTFGDHILYVNGIPLTATTTAGGTDTMSIPEESDLRIGGRLMGNDSYWLDGSISNFKLYDTALTAEEVKTLYDMGRCDEGHHVVNFSKTRVGIGLGDGEAPRAALDVRGDIHGGCPAFWSVYNSASKAGEGYVLFNTVRNGCIKNVSLDGTTGKITIQIAGWYKLDVHGMSYEIDGTTGAATASVGRFAINDSVFSSYIYTRLGIPAGIGVHNGVSGQSVHYLNVGDVVGYKLSADTNNSFYGSGYSDFSGFLLSM
jgi:hypothetical protein